MTALGNTAPLEDPSETLHPGMDARAILDYVAALVPSLARALGPGNEVVLHDLSRLPNSIVAIEGDLTGRAVGGPITDLALRQLRAHDAGNQYQYRTTLPDGRIMRSSTIFLKDASDVPVGCLCFNSDLTPWLEVERVVRSYIGEGRLPARQAAEVGGEMFVRTVDELASTMIRAALDSVGVPVPLMQKQHKLAAVRELDARGLFLIRDAVDVAARALGVTRYTIYNYLNEIRSSEAATLPINDPVAVAHLGDASHTPSARTRQIQTTLAHPAATGRTPQGVQVADARNFLFVSGQLPLDLSGSLVSADPSEQLRAALRNAMAVVTEAGGSLENVVQVTVLLRDLDLYGQIEAAFTEFFGNWRPAWNVAAVSDLLHHALVEVSMIAAVPGGTNHA